jgi:multidrug efflux pump subunit AcrA (membrane-fusion protein)
LFLSLAGQRKAKEPRMGIVRFSLRWPYTFYVLALLILFLGVTAIRSMPADIMRIQLFVPQEAAVGIKPGVAAIVRVAEIPGHPFPGQITRIADALDPGTRTLLTEIDVPTPMMN